MAIDFPTSPSNGDDYTYNGVTYVYNSATDQWIVQGTGSSELYVLKTGDTMTGSLTTVGYSGTTGTFSGQVYSNDLTANSTTPVFKSQTRNNTTNTGILWQGVGGTSTTSQIHSDGGATFNGEIKGVAAANAAGGYRHLQNNNGYYIQDDSGNSSVALYKEGGAQFKSNVNVVSTSGAKGLVNGDGFYQYATDGSTVKANILNSGAATFGGGVTVDGLTVGTSAISLSNTGLIYAPGTVNTAPPNPTTLYIGSNGLFGGSTSVRASKKNINYDSDCSWLADLKPISFNYRKTAEGEPAVYTEEVYDRLYYGLIAEEVEAIAPEICNYDTDGNLRGLEYMQLITPILSQLQSALKRIEALEAQLSTQGGASS